MRCYSLVTYCFHNIDLLFWFQCAVVAVQSNHSLSNENARKRSYSLTTPVGGTVVDNSDERSSSAPPSSKSSSAAVLECSIASSSFFSNSNYYSKGKSSQFKSKKIETVVNGADNFVIDLSAAFQEKKESSTISSHKKYYQRKVVPDDDNSSDFNEVLFQLLFRHCLSKLFLGVASCQPLSSCSKVASAFQSSKLNEIMSIRNSWRLGGEK